MVRESSLLNDTHMEEVIKYFESLEARLAAAEERLAAQNEAIAALQAQVEELQNRPLPEPQVVEKVVEKVVEVEKEPIVEEEKEEQASPKAAIYGKAVGDIRMAISLGDRFLYQRELFGQNAEMMQRTLNELNELASFDEAMAYISGKFDWDTESNTYQQFLVTLHRRFG